MKFLTIWQPFEYIFRHMCQGNGEIVNVYSVANFNRYLGLQFDCRDIPAMDKIEEINLNEGKTSNNFNIVLSMMSEKRFLRKSRSR